MANIKVSIINEATGGIRVDTSNLPPPLWKKRKTQRWTTSVENLICAPEKR